MKNLLIVCIFITLLSCSDKEKIIDYDAQNETEVAKYIANHKLTFKQTSSGLWYAITKEGTGEKKPTRSSNVTVYYKGYFTDGAVFDKSDADGMTLNLNQLISGFSEGISLLTEGGEATLIIPSKLGYGNKTVRTIPAGSVLVFDIKLLKIN